MPFPKPSSRALAVISSAIVLSLSAGYIALAWTEPVGTMPVTVAAPLNTGDAAQTKTGALALTGSLTASSFIDFNNNNYSVDPSGQTMLANLQAKNPIGNLVVRFEGLSNAYSSKLYLSSISSGDGGAYYDASQNLMNIFSYGDLRFNVGTGNISGAIANQRMVITQAGNIGIGTASPSGKLQIAGDASGWPLVIDAANTSNSYNTSIIKRSGQPVIAWGAYPGTWNPAIQIQNEDNSRLIWLSPLGPTSGANARMRTAATGLDFYVGGTTADAGTISMSLNSDGKVVIPGNLTVGGGLNVTGALTVGGSPVGGGGSSVRTGASSTVPPNWRGAQIWTQVVTHNLGRVPNVIRIHSIFNFNYLEPLSSVGTYDGIQGSYCRSDPSYQIGANCSSSSDGYVVNFYRNMSGQISAKVTAMDANTFTLVWQKTAYWTDSGEVKFMWEVQ
ncbi:MAG: hypothetical protein WC397_03545 [Candidatus Paceibacterota bacterium]|jgi:hypothetical protein